jgi:hypothetical protein
MIAKPMSDIAGLGAMAYDTLTGKKEGNAADFKQQFQAENTYQPRTALGSWIAQYNPMALVGKATDYLGGLAEAGPEASTGRKMLGAGIHEAVNQAPQFALMKAPPVLDATSRSLKSAARNTMQSALKPTFESLRTGKAGKAIDTMLDEGINVSPGGVSKIQDIISSLNQDIATKIQNSPAIIDKQAVMGRMQGLIDKFSKQVNPLNDIKAIQKAFDEFDLTVQNPISVFYAQELKQGTYKQLGDKSYGELKTADIEAQKALARGLKEEIARAVPEVQPLNARESALLNALSVSERRVLMEANKNPFGLGWLTTNPVHFAAWMADRSGLFKSVVARMLNTTAESLPEVGKMAPLGAVAANPGASLSSNNIMRAAPQNIEKPTGKRPANGYDDPEKEARYQAWKKANE